jgi:hypothetical protein
MYNRPVPQIATTLHQACLRQEMKQKLRYALKRCNPVTSKQYTSKECVLLWDEIEELSEKVLDVDGIIEEESRRKKKLI